MFHLLFMNLRLTVGWFNRHRRIIAALIMRELSTRYGRENIGFLWIIAEPMIFATGVSFMWSQIHPAYENGIKLIPFVITGYLPLILFRQMVGYSVNAVRVNGSLLYHRTVTPLHLILSRCLIEFIGVTLAFVTIVTFYCFMGIMSPPHSLEDFGYVLQGWFLLAWVSVGLTLIMAGVAEIFEFVERFVQIVTYVAIPVSGMFIMVVDMPPHLRSISTALPLVHAFEMIRRGFFGSGISVFYNTTFEIYSAAVLTFLGLLVALFVRNRVEVE